ncbi:TM177-like protein [Mya arenaria]|uniref:TM177-like protein n=1 Tax=Mya arenaria TaxID=6604 RepID=A0ABY7DE97_MYAAR|nr:TM177-like protein [Mya arenaria]
MENISDTISTLNAVSKWLRPWKEKPVTFNKAMSSLFRAVAQYTPLALVGVSFVGIPEHFQYSDVAQILAENSNFTTDDINSDDRLSSCLVLSESAKKFALTSEIHALNTYYIMFKFDFVPLLSLYCFVWDKLQKKVEKGHPLIQIVLFVGLMVAVVALGYIFEDQYEKWRIVQGDTKTALINGEYLDGGREYLQKQIEMNKVLRYLNKNGGQMKYTEDGETVQNFFNFGIPSLHTRLENLERLRQET